jgi:ABC-2 type transport system permease protein
MSALWREAALLLRSRAAVAALVVLTVLASVSVGVGVYDIKHQQSAIARLIEMQATDNAALKHHVAADAGSAAYYRFHATWDAPAPLAFAALGQRDVSPTLLRVRALALEGQIYESESGNPKLALAGRFDFAFVLIYLAPLVLIALLHDMWSSEREAGRLAMLQAMPRAAWRVWGARAVVRAALVTAALLLPSLAGAFLLEASLAEIGALVALVVALVVFWAIVALMIAARGLRSVTNAATLVALWFVVTLVAPAGANLAINATTPIPQGATLVRENREAVHDAWDLDRQTTLARFYESHPEWAHSPPLTEPFNWKWYFAFQQLGDEHVAAMSRAYRGGVARREQRAGWIAWLLPPIAIQRALHRVANTDVQAQLEYQDRVRAFHERLRRYYYPFLFDAVAFGSAEFDRTPEFRDNDATR